MPSDLIHPTQGRIYTLDRIVTDHAPWVILFTDPAVIDATTELADLTEATFSGYAREHPAWPAATDSGTGDAQSTSAFVTFSHNGGGVGNSIRGLALVEDDGGFGTHLLLAYLFPSPIGMNVLGDSISRQIRYLQGQYPLI